jgi:tetratricopeptide (TPR) repeat protein
MLKVAVLGHDLYREGQYAKSRVIFEGLAALDPEEAYYKTALGALHLAENRADDALKVLNESIALDGNDISALVHRGEAYLRKDDPLNAARDFRKAIELDPQGKDPLTRRARALAVAALRSVGTTAEEMGIAPATSQAKPGAPQSKSVAGARPVAAPTKSGAKPAAPAAKPGMKGPPGR